MVEADFSQYNLAIVKDQRIIYSSRKEGLRPLLEALEVCSGFGDDLVLHDKVLGLAAARLAVYAGIIRKILTQTISRPAVVFLEGYDIELKADRAVENILTRDRLAICPGERIALQAGDRDAFLAQIRAMKRPPVAST